jgi:hypothetical protein
VDRLRRHFTRYGEWWWVPVFYALAVAWIYRDLWHQHGAATGLGWDTIDSYGPDLDFFSREVREGRFSLWNPYDKGGYPLFCDPQIDRYYPLNWPFAAWGAMFGTGFWLVQIKVLAHHVVAASGMHLFLRTRRLGVRPSLIGGLAIIASAPMLTHKASIILWPLVWVPLVWVAIDAALAKPTWQRGVAVAAALTLPATAASPPGLWYALFAIAPYALWRLVAVRRTRDEWLRVAACVGVAALVLAPVLALAILPSRELVELGSRDRFATGRDFALALSLPEAAAMRGMFVRGAGLFETYMGATVIVLAACALAARPRFDRRAAIVLAITAVIGMVLAGGSTTPILPWLVDHVPGFGLLRIPGRYKLVAAFPIAALAGYGAAALAAARDDARLRVRVYATAGAALVVAIMLVAGWGISESTKERAAWWSIAMTAIAGGLAVAVVRVPRTWSEAALATLALCALFDAPAFTFVEPPAAEQRQLHERDDALVAQMPGIRDKWRIYDEFVLGERAGARLGVRDFRGYPAIDPLSLHRYTDVLDYAKKDPAIVTDFNVRYALVHSHFRDPGATYLRMPNPAFEPRGGGIWEAVHPAPLVVWYGAGVFVASAAEALPAMRALQEPDGDRRRVVLEPEDAARVPPDFTSQALEAREGQILRYEPDEIRIMLDAPRPGLVVLNEIMFPGWEVSVDGASATPLRANYLLRAVWVGAGPHQITWTFDPPHWRTLVGGYALALAAMLATLIRISIQRRTARRAS